MRRQGWICAGADHADNGELLAGNHGGATDAHAKSYADGDGHPDTDSHGHADEYADADCDTDRDANTEANTTGNSQWRFRAGG
jgi:hypothetical protein